MALRLPFLYPGIPRASRLLRRFSVSLEARKEARTENKNDYKGRLEAMLASGQELYPVISHSGAAKRISDIRKAYDSLSADDLAELADSVGSLTVRGRIHSIRAQGNKLLFIDLIQDDHKLQAIYRLNSISSLDENAFRESSQWLRPGDFVSITGSLTRTRAGELSVRASEKITLLSPCLHPIPVKLHNEQTLAHHRTVDLLIHPSARDVIRARAFILSYLRSFLSERDFLEVQTPILSDVAGGAAARPFVTHAAVLGGPSVALELRIAPELWLKRLVISGFDRVFEIGQVFRNEGIDATHNPEFTTCEFYQAFASLDDLMALTEDLLVGLVQRAAEAVPVVRAGLEKRSLRFDLPFARLDFVSTLQHEMGRELPEYVLRHDDTAKAEAYLKSVFAESHIVLPKPATVPRMLDKLCDHYIGPLLARAKTPVFLMNFPEILSPLSKSACPPGQAHRVARRFELYVDGKELVNAYEEENSPFAQREKFELQSRDRELGDAEVYATDWGYLSSMEWGLPPTGGWGIGVDRLVMLLTGTERISDVLSFGGIKGVVNQEE